MWNNNVIFLQFANFLSLLWLIQFLCNDYLPINTYCNKGLSKNFYFLFWNEHKLIVTKSTDAPVLILHSTFVSSTRFDVSNGIRKRVIYELVFLAIFEILLICLYFTPSEATSTNFVQVNISHPSCQRRIKFNKFWS